MKLVRFGASGAEKPGIVDSEGGVRDFSGKVDDISGAVFLPEVLAALRAVDVRSLPLAPPGVRLGPCVAGVGKIVGIGLNYSDHAAEVGRPVPSSPDFFLKATSSISGPTDPIVLPPGSQTTDWEAELAVVIGMPGKNIPESDAARHIAGFCASGDISERDYQAKSGPTAGKSFDGFTPLGPWLVTSDEMLDPYELDVTCDVNGHRYQDGNTANLVFRIPAILAHVSRYFSLQSGDVILTGTPAGVGKGQRPPRFLRSGDRLRIAVKRLGIQEHMVER
jgi:2-keto-4-pentenoate hydratase/2-oxohepta-3-ene-1,7-dioic acid hydratase in catechol pathway